MYEHLTPMRATTAIAMHFSRGGSIDAYAIAEALMLHDPVLFVRLAGIPANIGKYEDLRDALTRGDRLAAIKALRAADGLGLKEAKDTVNAFTRYVFPDGTTLGYYDLDTLSQGILDSVRAYFNRDYW